MTEDQSSDPPDPGEVSMNERLLAHLREEFPVMKEYRPLASGIDRQIRDELKARKGSPPAWRIIAAIRQHVREEPYLEAVSQGGPRFNIRGEPEGEVQRFERSYARRLLRGGQEESDAL
mgnify:CR=1 FL=1